MENTVKLIIFFLVLGKVPSRADPENRLLAYACGSNPPNNATLFAQILNDALSSAVNQVIPSGFSTTDKEASTETTTDSVYVLAQCRKDMSSADCLNCIKLAHNQIRNCSSVSAKAFYDNCFLRYENFNFYDVYTDAMHKQLCGTVGAASPTLFSTAGRSLMSDLCVATPQIDGYFAAQTRQGPSNTSIYGLAFCLRSLQRDSCETCLTTAQGNINNCFPSSEGRAIDAGCYLRYDSEPFFPTNATIDLAHVSSRGKKQASSTVWIIIGVVGGVFILGLFTCLLLFRKRKQGIVDIEGGTDLHGMEGFHYKAMKRATNNFNQASKIGQGGFGEVFKGTLKNGQVVAVKKLTLGRSARIISEFESEVKLICNVHHRNLVRLLGCCRHGEERLLIYEYMPNSSLDRILFGFLFLNFLLFISSSVTTKMTRFETLWFAINAGKNEKILSWKERFNIILGTARGLAYLHEEFHVCIIHRDIKASNILLDENFQAKIADFGLARLLPDDKTHVSTRFAGTLGYMAPEYAAQGKLTEKADTYSFGVVVLEILSGRKSIDLKQPPHMHYLLQWVWSLYEDNKVLQVVGSENEMEGYNEEEALRVINIALLCIQTSARHRPSMSEVVTMLSQDEIVFHNLLQPEYIELGNKAPAESSTYSFQSNATISETFGAR